MPLALGSRIRGSLVFHVESVSISDPEEGRVPVCCLSGGAESLLMAKG